MCGISGIISSEQISSEAAIKAASLQNHRGPDHFGFTASKTYCLCHNRLSVIDLSARSNQPIENENAVMVFNGEIYNYKSLARKYLNENNPVSDSMILFSLLLAKGAAILPELNGMFAFLYINKKDNSVIAARDRLGIKPLYYSVYNNQFYFASEIKTVVRLLETTSSYSVQDDLNDDFVFDCIAFGHAEFRKLPFNSIKECPPGAYLTFKTDIHDPVRHDYFDIKDVVAQKAEIRNDSFTELSRQLENLLNESVALHLISDAKVGVLCSGGLDSSLITALATRINPDIKIYHAGIEGRNGEEHYAEMVSQRYKLDLNIIDMNAGIFIESLPDTIQCLDVPIYHPSDVSLFRISQRAKADGVKSLLCGEGADELFCGYGWHLIFYRTLHNYSMVRKISNLVNNLYRALKLFRYADQFSEEEFQYYSGNYLTFTNQNIPGFSKRNSLLRNRESWSLLRDYKALFQSIDSFPSLAAFSVFNLYGHLPTLLQRNDRMCMMASIESRVPFLENRIIDFALQLDTKHKIRGFEGKYIIKKIAEKYLPRKVIYRKKVGFPVPWAKYLDSVNKQIFVNGFLSDFLSMSLEDLSFWIKDDKNMFFTALSIEIWGRLLLRRETPDSIKELLLKK